MQGSAEAYRLNIIIGNNIRKLRKRDGLTAKELGIYLGITQQQVSRYERGINQVHIDLLNQLSFLFKVQIELFFETQE